MTEFLDYINLEYGQQHHHYHSNSNRSHSHNVSTEINNNNNNTANSTTTPDTTNSTTTTDTTTAATTTKLTSAQHTKDSASPTSYWDSVVQPAVDDALRQLFQSVKAVYKTKGSQHEAQGNDNGNRFKHPYAEYMHPNAGMQIYSIHY